MPDSPVNKRVKLSDPSADISTTTETTPNIPSSAGVDTLNSFEHADAQINHDAAVSYWASTPATVQGVLGGFEHISKVELQGSANFVGKVRREIDNISTTTTYTSTNTSGIDNTSPSQTKTANATNTNGKTKEKVEKYDSIVDCGAGIGRVSLGLLSRLGQSVDFVEPVEKFCDVLRTDQRFDAFRGRVFQVGLEAWDPRTDLDGRKWSGYGIIWNQFCLNQLTDGELVVYLRKCRDYLHDPSTSSDENKGNRGWIMVKENHTRAEQTSDIFDETDSSVTRTRDKFEGLFENAGLRIVKTGVQKGLPKEIFPIRMWALLAKE